MRDNLRAELKYTNGTEKLKIRVVRLGLREIIDGLIADTDIEKEEKQCTRWLTSSMTGAGVRGG